MCDGQTKLQAPQEMQSIRPMATAFSSSSLRMNAAMSSGTSPQGQASTQDPQRMQGMVGRLLVSFLVSARMPFIPLTTGTWTSGSGLPIIGPPMRMRSGSSEKPPQWSIRAETGVPKGTRRLAGFLMAPPLTVTVREIKGRPWRTASCTASAVAVL